MTSDVFPAKIQVIFDALEGKGDVHVLNLYKTLTEKESNDQVYAQQFLGSYFTRLNRRLKQSGRRVSPGALKGTYRLIAIL